MFINKIRVLLLALSFFVYQEGAHAYVTGLQTKMDVSGNVVAVWQDDLNIGGYELRASVLPLGGSWSTPVTISPGGGTNASIPRIAINSSGNAIVIWTDYNPNVGYTSLYAVTLTGLTTWSSPAQVSEDTEHVYQDYFVKLSDNDDVVVTWDSFSFVTFEASIRAQASTFGTWNTPVTIAP